MLCGTLKQFIFSKDILNPFFNREQSDHCKRINSLRPTIKQQLIFLFELENTEMTK